LTTRARHAATTIVRPAPAVDGTPPVSPNLIRADAVADRRVGHNTVETLLFHGLSTPVALVLVVLQSRFLQPSGRGAFILTVLSVTILARLFGQLGYAVTNRMRERGASVLTLVHRALTLAVLLGVLGFAGIVAWGHLTRGIGAGDAAIAATALLPNVIWQAVSGVLLGLGRVRLWNYIQALPPVATLAGMLLLVVALGGGVRAALVAWASAHVITAAFALALTRDVWVPLALPRLLDLYGLAELALVMGAVQVVNLISYRVELFVLDRYRGIGAVGIYSIAMQTAESMWLVAAAIATSVTPPAVHDDEPAAVRLIGKAAVRGLLFTGILALGLALIAPFAIPLLLGHDFEGAARPLYLLLPGVVVYAPVTVLVVYLSVRRGKPRLSLAVAIVGMIVTAAAAFVLIPRYGASGAAAASSIGYAAGAGLAWVFFTRLGRTRGSVQGAMRPVAQP
jgi:O-antigen/teichoic acid export membrane protein